jgi:hypothetical protein
MMKFLLNLTPGEPLSPMKKLPYLNDPMEFDSMLSSVFCICVHDPINVFLFDAGRIDLCRGKLFGRIRSVQEKWKI